MLGIYSHWGHASLSWRRVTWSTHEQSPLWRPFTDDLTTVGTENKGKYTKRDRTGSDAQTRENRDPTHLDPPSTGAHSVWNQKDENIAIHAIGDYKGIQGTEDTAQPDTIVTIYTD